MAVGNRVPNMSAAMLRSRRSNVIVLLLSVVLLAGCADTESSSSQSGGNSAAVQPAKPGATRVPTTQAARTQSSTSTTCNDYLFLEAAEEVGLDCPDLPPLSATGVVVTDPPGKRGRIRDVVDGDTLRITFGDEEVRVRIFIADTPETNPAECYGIDAAIQTEKLLPVGSIAWFEEGKTKVDQYGRSLFYVWFEQGEGRYRLLQDAIIRDGYGEVVIYPPDNKYEAWLRQGQSDAERLGRGLWSACGAMHLAVAPTATSIPQSFGISSNTGNCDASYPTVCIPPVSQAGDLDCRDVSYRRFQVLQPDPHNFDADFDGIGCES